MLRPRIERIDLRYGCHARAWDIPEDAGPLVIVGPNGSGKSTLLEGILACLFGSQRSVAGAGHPQTREKADGEPGAGLIIARGDERYEIRRDLRTGRVVVRVPAADVIRFDGWADTRATTPDSQRYRRILADLLGITDRDTYVQTLFVRQGDLAATTLGEHLLRVASGGHTRVEVAHREIAGAHRALTARPLDDTDRPAADARELEKVEAEIRSLEDRLAAARAAGARRGPLALDRDRMEARLHTLIGEIEQLEEAHAALARGTAIEVNARQLKDLVRRLEESMRAVPEAADRLDAARSDAAREADRGLYPDDFPERLARADLRWRDLERLGARSLRWPAALTLLLLALAAGLFAAPPAAWPAVAAGLGALAGGAAWLALWVSARRQRAELRADLDRILAGVPGADDLGPGTRDDAQREFLGQQQTRRRLDQARARLLSALREGRAQLRAAAAAGVWVPPRDSGEGGRGEEKRKAPAILQARIAAAVAALTERLMRERRELDQVGDASLHLPAGVAPTAAGVAEALRERRSERRKAEEVLQDVGQELLERGTPAESLDALEAALSALLPRREALIRKAEVLEEAHTLLTAAYDAFRATDQERLVRLVSDHADRLTGGALGPLVVEHALEDAKITLDGRTVPPRSPPLSFGEMHALLLAIRLGAADFLGGMGVYPPLLLDDPFVHLDPDRAALLWNLLEVVAGERQVILSTQDALLVDSLGIEPGIRLGPDTARAEPEAERVPA